MPSILPDYEYDIFISYRHKDNRTNWVTSFIKALKIELDTTFKENISIYYDENPQSGLLKNHDVDKSLQNKLKSVVFIPIVSQTYCDQTCFAWRNEFCFFNRTAREEEIGRDIKLNSGNVASRILPITIHELDTPDIKLIEDELKSKFRGVDFVFKAPGVNRALLPDDKPEENFNKLLYRDQINKLANALKEILYSIREPNKIAYESIPSSDQDSQYFKLDEPKKQVVDEKPVDNKSIAVLPFLSLAQDNSQEYFADGITENILMQLASLNQLRVISRTSVMRYKKTTKSIPEIASELGVKYVLEGSAQSHANKVRINAQLIDAEKDDPIWSKVFVESMEDIFSVQDKVAEVVAEQLQASLHPVVNQVVKETPTKNLEAYDLYLKGRHAFNLWNVEGYKTASDYFKKALEKDPEFKLAYSYLASSYSARMSWNGDLSPFEALPHIELYLSEAWKRGASFNDYLTKAFVEFFVKKDFNSTANLLQKASELSPNDATVLYTFSYLYCMMGKFDDAQSVIQKAKLIEPHGVAFYNYQAIYLYLTGKFEEAITLLSEGIKLFSQVIRFNDHLGRVYLTMGKFSAAKETLLAGLKGASFRPPSMVAYLATALWQLNEKENAKELLNELSQRSEKREKGVNYYMAIAQRVINPESSEALSWIHKSKQTNDIDLIWLDVDPLLKGIEKDNIKLEGLDKPDYRAAESFILNKIENELPDDLPYHNLAHTHDVLNAALTIAANENIEQQEIDLLRLAALYHDSGFTKTYKNHEELGCQLAKETLPTFGISNEQLEVICGMIMATKIPQSPNTQLEKILCDADLDYLGRDDFYEIGNRLFKEMADRGYLENEREWNLTQKVFLENHRYHTSFSKENREDKKQEHLNRVLGKLKR